MAIKFHPDKNPEITSAEEKFKEAAEAYEVLKRRRQRARYDQFGHAGVGGAAEVVVSEVVGWWWNEHGRYFSQLECNILVVIFGGGCWRWFGGRRFQTSERF